MQNPEFHFIEKRNNRRNAGFAYVFTYDGLGFWLHGETKNSAEHFDWVRIIKTNKDYLEGKDFSYIGEYREYGSRSTEIGTAIYILNANI